LLFIIIIPRNFGILLACLGHELSQVLLFCLGDGFRLNVIISVLTLMSSSGKSTTYLHLDDKITTILFYSPLNAVNGAFKLFNGRKLLTVND
jgi:hypothetical protein